MATAVESDLKTPFSFATTTKRSEGRYSFSWFAILYQYLKMQTVKQVLSNNF